MAVVTCFDGRNGRRGDVDDEDDGDEDVDDDDGTCFDKGWR